MERGRDWLWLTAAALAGSALVFAGVRWLLPAGQALLAWPILLKDLRAGRLRAGAWHMLYWALAMSVAMIALTVRFPSACEAAVLRGAAYREEMFAWIRTGIGAEGTPAQFIPQHISHYLLTLGSSLLTAGLAGLALGAVLLNYMNFYVGSLIRESAHPWIAACFGWPIWPVLRVVAFSLGAIALAYLGLARIARRGEWRPAEMRRMLLLSLGFFFADMAIKAVLAHPWRHILLAALQR